MSLNDKTNESQHHCKGAERYPEAGNYVDVKKKRREQQVPVDALEEARWRICLNRGGRYRRSGAQSYHWTSAAL
jgi:hypothetical protein